MREPEAATRKAAAATGGLRISSASQRPLRSYAEARVYWVFLRAGGGLEILSVLRKEDPFSAALAWNASLQIATCTATGRQSNYHRPAREHVLDSASAPQHVGAFLLCQRFGGSGLNRFPIVSQRG